MSRYSQKRIIYCVYINNSVIEERKYREYLLFIKIHYLISSGIF